MNKRLQSTLGFILTVTLLMLSVSFLSGCEQRKQNQEQLSFQFALPDGWEVINKDFEGRIVHQANTDGVDGTEWIVLYTFDMPAQAALKPVSCAIYHAVRREPRLPIIYPYHLQAPGWTYLGEGGTDRVSVRVEDVITNIKPDTRPGGRFDQTPDIYFSPVEVIIESRDAGGNITRASIFQWRNTLAKEHWKRVDPEEWLVVPGIRPEQQSQFYECLGFFEATLKVQVGVNQVEVWDRAGDRSQLARVTTYRPRIGPDPDDPAKSAVVSDAYLDANDQLFPPESSCLAFAFGYPEDVGNSPYPEKIVMAYHAKLRSEADNYGGTFLSENGARGQDKAWQEFQRRVNSSTQPPCVTRVVYEPPAETSSTAKSYGSAAGAEAAGKEPEEIRAQVTTLARYGSQDPSEEGTFIVWDLVQVDNAWKIDRINEIR
jgi:hypothetical protein